MTKIFNYSENIKFTIVNTKYTFRFKIKIVKHFMEMQLLENFIYFILKNLIFCDQIQYDNY